MRVFVTGATGFIGMAVVQELLAADHQVVGMARADDKAAALAALGAEVWRGVLEDRAALQEAAARADGVIHLAFNHDFSRFVQNCEADREIVAVLGAALAGSRRQLLVTSGAGITGTVPGEPARENGARVSSAVIPRAATEEAAAQAAAGGANVSVVRLPQVHDTRRQGFVTSVIAAARQNGVSAYAGDGANRWAAAHLSDVARLYRLALEKAAPDAKYHAVAEEGVALRRIAEANGRRLALPVKSLSPEDTQSHFGWLANFVTRDMPASSALTRAALDWHPSGPDLVADLERLQIEG